MKILSFSRATPEGITQHGSGGSSLAPILGAADGRSVACLYLAPNGLLGVHPAGGDELLRVVSGKAVVKVAESTVREVAAKSAVLWRSGEVRETRALETGVVAIVVEGEELASRRVIRIGGDGAGALGWAGRARQRVAPPGE
jgi:hypothetical protein